MKEIEVTSAGALAILKSSDVITTCAANFDIEKSIENCTQDSYGIVAWEIKNSDEMKCFKFDNSNASAQNSSGTVVRLTDVHDAYKTFKKANYPLYWSILGAILTAMIVAIIMTGAFFLLGVFTLSGLAGALEVFILGSSPDVKMKEQQDFRRSIQPEERLYFFGKDSAVPFLLNFNEHVSEMVKEKMLSAISDEEREDIERWAKMLKQILETHKGFPTNLIPESTDEMKEVFNALQRKIKELGMTVTDEEAPEEHAELLTANYAVAARPALTKTTTPESAATLEIALQVVDGLNFEDFEKVRKRR